MIIIIADARTLHGLSEGTDTEPLMSHDEVDPQQAAPQRAHTVSELPVFENTAENQDNLFDVSLFFRLLWWL